MKAAQIASPGLLAGRAARPDGHRRESLVIWALIVVFVAGDALLGHQTVLLVSRNGTLANAIAILYGLVTAAAPYFGMRLWRDSSSRGGRILGGFLVVVALAAIAGMCGARWMYGADAGVSSFTVLSDAQRSAREGRNAVMALIMLILSLGSFGFGVAHAWSGVDQRRRQRVREIDEEISSLRAWLSVADDDPQTLFDLEGLQARAVAEGEAKAPILMSELSAHRKRLALYLVSLFESPRDAREFMERFNGAGAQAMPEVIGRA